MSQLDEDCVLQSGCGVTSTALFANLLWGSLGGFTLRFESVFEHKNLMYPSSNKTPQYCDEVAGNVITRIVGIGSNEY